METPSSSASNGNTDDAPLEQVEEEGEKRDKGEEGEKEEEGRGGIVARGPQGGRKIRWDHPQEVPWPRPGPFPFGVVLPSPSSFTAVLFFLEPSYTFNFPPIELIFLMKVKKSRRNNM